MLVEWINWRANRALQAGDLSQAAALLKTQGRSERQPNKPLTHKLTRSLIVRAQRSTCKGDLSAAWTDLSTASEIALPEDQDSLSRQKSNLVEVTVEAADSFLSQGKIAAAIGLVRELESREILDWRADRIGKTARLIQASDQAAARGNMAASRMQLEQAEQLRPDLTLLETRKKAAIHHWTLLKQTTRLLQKAFLKSKWEQAEQYCRQLLAIAPNYQVAIDARTKLFENKKNQGDTPTSVIKETVYEPLIQFEWVDQPVCESRRTFLIWVDSVGGFLVCPGDVTFLGAAVPDSNVEIPLMGDLRRRHARIDRVKGGHAILPFGSTTINGKTIVDSHPLTEGCRIEMENAVRLTYRQPHPLSQSAKLEFASRHRTQPWSDGIVLACGSIILGPESRNHIHCPNWNTNVVLFWRDGVWNCRADRNFQIDGASFGREGKFHLKSRIVGEDFSFSIEEVKNIPTRDAASA